MGTTEQFVERLHDAAAMPMVEGEENLTVLLQIYHPLLVEAATLIEKISTEGVPGVMNEVDRAFYTLVVAERNHAWREVEILREALRGLEALR